MSSYYTTITRRPKPQIGILLSKQTRRGILRASPKQGTGRTAYHDDLRDMKILQHDAEIIFKLGRQVTRNVIEYARSITRAGSRYIDRNIFDAQMARHFNMTNLMMLDRMFHLCCIDDSHCVVTIRDFVELMCIFLTEIRDLKIRYAFRIYTTTDDELKRSDITCLIGPMVENMATEDEDLPPEKEFVDMLVAVMDRNDDGSIDLDEFRKLVDDDILMLQCLGTCLPSEEDRYLFLSYLTEKSQFDVQRFFRFERRICLGSDLIEQTGTIQKYYPVPLELP